MFAVIFEVWPKADGKDEYLGIAAELRQFLEGRDGFMSIERFQSLTDEGKLLSLSFWRDEEAIRRWREQLEHRDAQRKGRDFLFNDYRIRVARVERDYSLHAREQAPGI